MQLTLCKTNTENKIILINYNHKQWSVSQPFQELSNATVNRPLQHLILCIFSTYLIHTNST